MAHCSEKEKAPFLILFILWKEHVFSVQKRAMHSCKMVSCCFWSLSHMFCVLQMWTSVRRTLALGASVSTPQAPTPATAALATRARSPGRSAEVRVPCQTRAWLQRTPVDFKWPVVGDIKLVSLPFALYSKSCHSEDSATKGWQRFRLF